MIEALTPYALRQWVESAKPGEWCSYHVGSFASRETCALAMRLYDSGEVTLAQKRLAPGVYDYRALRTVPARGRR